MDRNSIIGIVLLVLLVLGFNFFNAKNSAEEAKQRSSQVDSTQATTQKDELTAETYAEMSDSTQTNSKDFVLGDSLMDLAKRNKFGVFYPASSGEDTFVPFETNLLKGKIARKGGYIAEVELKNFSTYDSMPLVLFNEKDSYYDFALNYKNLTTKDLFFKSRLSSVKLVDAEGSQQLVLRAKGENGKYIDFRYTFYANDYKVDFDMDIHGFESDILASSGGLVFDWKQSLPSLEKSFEDEQRVSTVYYYNREEGRDYLSQTDREQETIDYQLDYLAMRHKFFTSSLIPVVPFKSGAELSTETTTGDYFEVLNAKATIPYEAKENFNFSSYFVFAPIDLDILKSYEAGLDEQIEFGWGIISWMNEYFISPIFHFLVDNGLNVGLAILVLTLFIKMILFPITYKNYLSSAKMRVIKPQLDKINEENKDADPVKKQQAVMQLYKSTGVNPMAGCIPALLQMPILFAMFRFFPNAIGLRQESFLWAEDLSTFDAIVTWTTEIPLLSSFYGNHVSLFTILMAISLFFYTRFNNQMTPTAGGNEMQMKQIKVMMNLMPVMMLFFFNNYASGLSYYYLLANMITIGQTLAIKRFFINEEAIMQKIEEHKKKPMKASKWQKKMQEIAEKQNGRK